MLKLGTVSAAMAAGATSVEAQTPLAPEKGTQQEKPLWETLRLTEEEYGQTLELRTEMTEVLTEAILPFFKRINTRDTIACAAYIDSLLAGNEQREPDFGRHVAIFRDLYTIYWDNPVDAKPHRVDHRARASLTHLAGIIQQAASAIATQGLKSEADRVRQRMLDARTAFGETMARKPALSP